MTVEDPFAGPAPIQSNFASIQSFRGRLVLIEPTKTEMAVNDDNGKLQERITADITTVDGKGAVKIYKRREDTGRTLTGPRHPGVWIGQPILVDQLKNDDGSIRKMVLARVDTKTPGQPAAKGNPWGLIAPTDADKQMARDFLANRTIEQAAAPASAQDENPFAKAGDAPF